MSFDKAYEELVDRFEGRAVYVNDPDDPGGETWSGIARRYNRDWTGWALIDGMKNHPNFPAILRSNERLERKTRERYRERYWEPWDGDSVTRLSYRVAFEVFECGVNIQWVLSVTWFQRALNALNRQGRLFPNLVEDADVGPKTLGALEIVVKKGDARYVVALLNHQQGCYYLKKMRESEVKEKYARGWLERTTEMGA